MDHAGPFCDAGYGECRTQGVGGQSESARRKLWERVGRAQSDGRLEPVVMGIAQTLAKLWYIP